MGAKEISVKKYVVRLSGEERERLEALLRKGKSPAQRLLKARILLKADVSEAGEGWSDSRIIKALDTSVSMVYRVRKQLVEEGFEAVLSRKQRARPAVARIFDGEKEAKLIALACSKPPKGRVRWTLRLLENKVVELRIVDRASDSTIGRTLKRPARCDYEYERNGTTGPVPWCQRPMLGIAGKWNLLTADSKTASLPSSIESRFGARNQGEVRRPSSEKFSTT